MNKILLMILLAIMACTTPISKSNPDKSNPDNEVKDPVNNKNIFLIDSISNADNLLQNSKLRMSGINLNDSDNNEAYIKTFEYSNNQLSEKNTNFLGNYNKISKTYVGDDYVYLVGITKRDVGLVDGSKVDVGFISKKDFNGNEIWNIQLYQNGSRNLYTSINNGIIYIAGQDLMKIFLSNKEIDIPSSDNLKGSDMFFLKIDSSGQLVTYTLIGGNYLDSANKITVSDKYVYILGRTSSKELWYYNDNNGLKIDDYTKCNISSSTSNAILLQLDKDGIVNWVRCINDEEDIPGALNIDLSSGSEYIFATGTYTKDNGAYIAKYSDSGIQEKIMKFNNGTSVQGTWEASVNISDFIFVGDTIYATGYTKTNLPSSLKNSLYGKKDLLMMCLDTNLVIKFTDIYGSENDDVGLNIYALNNNTIILSGYTISTFESSKSVNFLPTDTDSNVKKSFILSYILNGNRFIKLFDF